MRHIAPNTYVHLIRRTSHYWPSTKAGCVARLSRIPVSSYVRDGYGRRGPSRGNPNCRQTVANRVEAGAPAYPRFRGFTCKTTLSRSGRCWFRTSDLCRVNAKAWRRRCSPMSRNAWKPRHSSQQHPAAVRRCSHGLVYYWCKGIRPDTATPMVLRALCARRRCPKWGMRLPLPARSTCG